MTGTVATAHWRRLDTAGTDRCALSRADHGWMLTGRAVWQDPVADGDLAYVVRCDPHWNSLSADVTGVCGGRDIALCLLRTGEGWTVNGTAQPGLVDCQDVDLSFTPATNLMPLRRLGTAVAGTVLAVRAAWLIPDLSGLQRLDQTYTTRDDGTVLYASPGFSAPVEAHSSGFVTRYGALWTGWVDE